MEALSIEGLEAIAVGIPHGSKHRIAEYSPFPTQILGPLVGLMLRKSPFDIGGNPRVQIAMAASDYV